MPVERESVASRTGVVYSDCERLRGGLAANSEEHSE